MIRSIGGFRLEITARGRLRGVLIYSSSFIESYQQSTASALIHTSELEAVAITPGMAKSGNMEVLGVKCDCSGPKSDFPSLNELRQWKPDVDIFEGDAGSSSRQEEFMRAAICIGRYDRKRYSVGRGSSKEKLVLVRASR